MRLIITTLKDKLSYYVILSFIAGLFWPNTASSQRPDTCWVGIYVVNVYDVAMDDRSFSADFWVWKKYKAGSELCNFDSNYVFDYANAIDYKKEFISVLDKHGFQIRYEKIRASLIFDADGRNFPFDNQSLPIVLEEPEYDTTSLVYIPEYKDCGVDDSVLISDWKINSFTVARAFARCETNYGHPTRTNGYLVYPRVVAKIGISRLSPFTTYFKLLTATFVALFLALIVFLIRPDFTDPRFGIPVGALIAAVANKYVIETIIPETSRITLLDQIHIITFIVILTIISISIYSLRKHIKGDDRSLKIMRRTDYISFVALLLIYIISVFSLTLKAM